MPQPFAAGTVKYSPRILLKERPEHAARIGLVSAEWSALEDHVIQVVAFGLFMRFDKPPRHDFDESYNVAKTALLALESLNARLTLIDDLLEPRIAPELFRHWADKLRPELRNRAKERNRVAHTHWGISSACPNDVVTFKDEGKQRYSLKDFDDIVDRIIDTSNAVATFMAWISGSLTPPFPVTPPLLR